MQDANLVPLKEAIRLFPSRGGRRLSVKAIRRRIHSGVKGVRLNARRCGGEWFTSREWVEEFLERCTDVSLRPAVPVVRHPAKTPERVKQFLARRYGINGAR